MSQHEKLKKEGKINEAKRFLWLRCATDLELFALTYFSHYCEFVFNDLHRDLFLSSKFAERSVRRARAAPRGYAKSTVTVLIKPIHDVCYKLEKFIVIFSNTTDQSNQKLKDIRTEILTNHRLIDDYGIHFLTKSPGESQYIIHCDNHSCLFQSYGSGTEVRGIRYGPDRPSKIIVDDGEHSEEVLNEAIRRKYEDWYFQVVSNIGNQFTNIETIGTILHPESLLANLIKNPAYNGKIYKAVISFSTRQDLWEQWTCILNNVDNENRHIEAQEFYDINSVAMLDGVKVLWAQKESYLYLMKELVEKGRRAFFKEKQNEPIGGDEALFDQFHWYRETSEGFVIESNGVLIPWKDLKYPDGRWLNSFGVLDPSAGQNKSKVGKLGDYACILAGIKHRERLFVHEDMLKRISPTKQIESIFEFDNKYDFTKFGVETNLFRNLMMPNIETERKRLEKKLGKEIRVPFYDIENTDKKEERITTLEPKVTHGFILFNRALSQTCMRQHEAYPHVDHDDAPDALHMLWNLCNNRYKASALGINAQGGK